MKTKIKIREFEYAARPQWAHESAPVLAEPVLVYLHGTPMYVHDSDMCCVTCQHWIPAFLGAEDGNCELDNELMPWNARCNHFQLDPDSMPYLIHKHQEEWYVEDEEDEEDEDVDDRVCKNCKFCQFNPIKNFYRCEADSQIVKENDCCNEFILEDGTDEI